MSKRMKQFNLKILCFALVVLNINTGLIQDMELNLSKVSEVFLLAVKQNNTEAVEKFTNQLNELDFNVLANSLDNDQKKKTFWINVYNGFIIDKLRKDSSLYENRGDFFSEKNILIAGEKMSFDFIEHGIIRRSKVKLSLGFFGKLFPSKMERKLRTDKLDYRIHFALNCGAKACPPVKVYSAKNIEKQLSKSEKDFVKKVTEYDESENKVTTTAIFSWFRGDFGNKRGIRKIIRRHLGIEEKRFKVEFRKYDWTLDIDNFVDHIERENDK